MSQAVDYRVSKVVVLCKDCGQDVGLYPARHKCQDVVRPPLPPLPTKYTSNPNDLQSPSNGNLRVPRKPVASADSDSHSHSRSRPTSAASSSSSSTFNTQTQPPSDNSSMTSSSTGGKWSRFVRSGKQQQPEQAEQTNPEDESVYFNNFAAHLPETTAAESPNQGRKLWGKVRQNEKWKQLNELYDKPKQSGKIWGKLIQATQNMADRIPSRDDRGPESDESDWEGETHVSRVLREYYESKHAPLPPWLFDGRAPITKRAAPMREEFLPHGDVERKPTSGRKQRLWEVEAETDTPASRRERERAELRQQKHRVEEYAPPPPSHRSPPPSRYDDYYDDHSDRYGRSRHHPPPPTSPTRARHDYYDERPRPSRYSGYDDDYRSPPQARSPPRQFRDQYDEEEYHSYRSPPRERTRGPRNMPPSSNHRYPERTGYF